MNEGSDDTAVGPGRRGERRAAEESAPAGVPRADDDKLQWGEAEAAQPGPGDLDAGQPNLEPDPPVAGRRSRISPAATDDGPTTPLS